MFWSPLVIATIAVALDGGETLIPSAVIGTVSASLIHPRSGDSTAGSAPGTRSSDLRLCLRQRDGSV